MIIVIIGPMGCGKTTVGELLAERLSWTFADADDFHPPENVEKMRQGIPLDDDDRFGWLASLRTHIEEQIQRDKNLILACSALKHSYREILGIDQRRIISVYLKGSFELLQERIAKKSPIHERIAAPESAADYGGAFRGADRFHRSDTGDDLQRNYQ